MEPRGNRPLYRCLFCFIIYLLSIYELFIIINNVTTVIIIIILNNIVILFFGGGRILKKKTYRFSREQL